MSYGEHFGFEGMDGGLSSFVNLLMIIGGMEPRQPGEWGDYLTCVSLMPGKGVKPTHPFFLPTRFDPDGPPASLPPNVVQQMESRFARLRGISEQLKAASDDGEPTPERCDTLGPIAMEQIRGLCTDLGVRRCSSGEHFVWSLKLRALIPPAAVHGAELVQIASDVAHVYEDPEESNSRLPVVAHRLVYRLCGPPQPGFPTEEFARTRDEIVDHIRSVVREKFSTVHVIVELRDCDAATVHTTEVIGPSYGEVQAERERLRSQPNSDDNPIA